MATETFLVAAQEVTGSCHMFEAPAFSDKNENNKVVFSEDLGNKSAVFMNVPSVLTKADLVLMEGTYGDRNHRPIEDSVAQLKEILSATQKRRGNIMTPAFAVGRTQELFFI